MVGSGRKNTVVPVPRAGADLLERPDRVPLLEAHLPLRAVAAHGRDELLRQRIDDAGADAVQAAGGLVVARLELAAGVQGREDHLEGALLRLRMLVDRNAAAVVRDRDRRLPSSCSVTRDVRGVAVHRLVDGVVEDLPDEMMQAGGADAADIHAGTLADGLEPFENGDVFCCVSRCHSDVERSPRWIVARASGAPGAAGVE